MSVILKLNESSATLRVVPLPPLVQSNGTSACTNESGRTFTFSIGGVFYGSGGSISAVSATDGLYTANFAASRISVAGQGAIYYSSNTALPASTPIEVVGYDSFDSMRMGLFALPNAAAEASGGIITFGTGGGQLHTSNGSVGLKAQTHSDVTIKGIQTIQAGVLSGVSIEVKAGGIQTTSIGVGNYSGVSVGIYNKGIEPRSFVTASVYSHVTIGGVNDYANISNVTLHAGTHSNVTIKGIQNYANISDVTLHAGTHSNVTIQGVSNTSSAVQIVSDITGGVWYAGSRSGVTIDGVAFLSAAGNRSIASSLLSTNMGDSRILQEFYWPLRNRVQISGSTGTVFLTDDATSAWTFSVTTAEFPLGGTDPGGP